ncbi:Glutamine synthetase root isozyme 3 [Vitis vinifera]|uniref:Glutamine synthetase root isozyme 3 n=1 Tax=Vitis vinifera TaxID=29760 RepID=A0A438HYH8_VITVI|nr:Glutamine synthetase root isozyme 3 [Vitis vinifera]
MSKVPNSWDLIHVPSSELHAPTSPWPFSVWGVNIIGKISLKSSSGHEFILVAIDYFTKSENDLRSKARTLSGPVIDLTQLPKWNYDGSSTGQAPGENSEVILYPQAIFKDPFRGGDNIMVMCDAYTPEGEPIPTNKRFNAA